jgi:DNA helicase-2/ATP-dependent DNA helicase PcrA
METVGDFQVESPIAHLIVDEYQDLNKCDLAVIAGIVAKAGCELFIAGDDDQSIYGFRKAHPEGIRSFATQYPGSASLELTICKRCDPPILSLGEFVAQLDPHRLAKTLSPDPARRGGEVRILRFPSQTEEAQSIATIVRRRIDVNGITPGDVLILLRSDRNGAYSSVLKSALELRGIPVASTTEQESALDTNAGRVIVNFLRLLESDSDDLALFQVIRFRANQIGAATVGAIYQIAQARTVRFSEALSAIESAPEIVDRGEIVQTEVRFLRRLARTTLPDFQVEQPDIQTLEAKLTQLLASLHAPGIESDAIKAELLSLAARSNLRSLASLLKAIQETEENIEQERDPQKVNILTMHRAKGLTSHTVFIVAAENEVVPGKNYQEPGLGDERRLLYVSLTRAEHELIITHCDQRFGQQMMQGANAGNRRRTLTQFLRDCPVHSTDGLAYVRTLAPPA